MDKMSKVDEPSATEVPPPYSEQPDPVQPTPVHVVATPGTVLIQFGKEQTHLICPHCHAEIDTSTEKEAGLVAWITGGVLALLGCWLGCCLIPCCMDSCKDTHHTCPNCKAYLGRYRAYA